ncbi:copper chaperone PCu(A)C [Demequina sp. TTPB684]|uniref:copper chaperone PCu(A)C n=1 Tax=unclassified Demequina TaxID=2620311 RepID=UPI001CF2417E|nr:MULTISPECIES: copper chaperone PCu(A)C [unclassified Demequina]MCB2411387.1 copper chaperone PCu(A)C [Demequina sp. TTPB684]UPU87770.1 copper chaperone PCu(A)C [Demequina sp. TMPB413]
MFALSRAALVAAIALTLASCSTGSPSDDASSLTITDTWAKAADDGMTAAFASVHNNADRDITITGASSPAAMAVELHEVVDDEMRQVDGGFTVPAGETLMLEPGGLHLMFMGISQPIAAGDEVTVTLTLSDGTHVEFTAVAKDFAGANEDYDGGMEMESSSPEPSQ